MFVKMKAGGGSSSVKSGTTAATTTASQEITIPTGVSPLNKFVWIARGTNSSAGVQMVVYDRNVSTSNFSYGSCGRYAGERDTTFKTSGNAYTMAIKNVSNDGTVTLIASTNIGYVVDAGYWYAE